MDTRMRLFPESPADSSNEDSEDKDIPKIPKASVQNPSAFRNESR